MSIPKFPPTSLLLTAFVAASLVGLNFYSIYTLSSRDWCAQIMTAEKFVGDKTRTDAATVQLVVEKCAATLFEQLQSVGWIATILAGALALSMAAMFVVKFAGAQASGSLPGGGSFDFRKAQGAQQVADAAQGEATDIKGGV